VQVIAMVGRTYQHTNRETLIEGDLLPVRPRRSRAARVTVVGPRLLPGLSQR
jgi:hypothetical protein